MPQCSQYIALQNLVYTTSSTTMYTAISEMHTHHLVNKLATHTYSDKVATYTRHSWAQIQS